MAQSTQILTPLDRFKEYLNMTQTDMDTQLTAILQSVSGAIQNAVKRRLTLWEHTGYYDGDGEHVLDDGRLLLLRNWPIISAASDVDLYDDDDRAYGASTKIDADNIIVYPEEGWIRLDDTSFDAGERNIKITYTAGYSALLIAEADNDSLDFQVSSTEYNVTLDSGEYNAETLATEIQAKMGAESSGVTFTVTYNKVSQKFKIAGDGSFDLLLSSGANSGTSVADTIGYEASDATGITSKIADNKRVGVPDDLDIACKYMAEQIWNDSKPGEGRAGVRSTVDMNDNQVTYMVEAIPPLVQHLMNPYKQYMTNGNR